jgi:hypothetical protein
MRVRMMKRTNLLLNEDEMKEAQRILRKRETTLSAWMRLQIRKLVERHKQRKEP